MFITAPLIALVWFENRNQHTATKLLHRPVERLVLPKAFAIAALFTGNHGEKGRLLTESACKLARQARQMVEVDLILLVLEHGQAELKLCGWRKQIVVKPLDGPWTSPYYRDGHLYTKMNLWNLTQYKRVLYLDLDTLPIAQFAGVFETPIGHIGMAHDMGFMRSPHDKDVSFNSGVILLRPDADVFKALVGNISLLSYDAGMADQSYLNTFFLGNISVLDPQYNALLSHRDRWPAHVAIVHYTWIKPWESWACFWAGVRDMEAIWNMA